MWPPRASSLRRQPLYAGSGLTSTMVVAVSSIRLLSSLGWMVALSFVAVMGRPFPEVVIVGSGYRADRRPPAASVEGNRTPASSLVTPAVEPGSGVRSGEHAARCEDRKSVV